MCLAVLYSVIVFAMPYFVTESGKNIVEYKLKLYHKKEARLLVLYSFEVPLDTLSFPISKSGDDTLKKLDENLWQFVYEPCRYEHKMKGVIFKIKNQIIFSVVEKKIHIDLYAPLLTIARLDENDKFYKLRNVDSLWEKKDTVPNLSEVVKYCYYDSITFDLANLKVSEYYYNLGYNHKGKPNISYLRKHEFKYNSELHIYYTDTICMNGLGVFNWNDDYSKEYIDLKNETIYTIEYYDKKIGYVKGNWYHLKGYDGFDALKLGTVFYDELMNCR
jgi:hypothetical protein